MKKSLQVRCIAALFAALLAGAAGPARAQTIVLYDNDFETPNQPIVRNCGFALDQTPINTLFGTPQGLFQQTFTVEAVLVTDASGTYSDPSGTGGNYAIGMLASTQDDRLGLTFDLQGRKFLNVSLDISSIDVNGCGGPFGVADPIYRLTLYDDPGGSGGLGTGTLLDQQEITGPQGADQWTFNWTHHVVALDGSAATSGTVRLEWDLTQSGYAAFDNLIIAASDTEGGIGTDTDGDGIADEDDNCPNVANADQADANDNGIGDACESDDACADPATLPFYPGGYELNGTATRAFVVVFTPQGGTRYEFYNTHNLTVGSPEDASETPLPGVTRAGDAFTFEAGAEQFAVYFPIARANPDVPRVSFFLNVTDGCDRTINVDPDFTLTGVQSDAMEGLALGAALPSPTAGVAAIPFSLDQAGPARLAVYDVLGREVAVLVNGTMGAGRQQATFDGTGLPSGLYVIRLEAGGRHFTRLLTLAR